MDNLFAVIVFTLILSINFSLTLSGPTGFPLGNPDDGGLELIKSALGCSGKGGCPSDVMLKKALKAIPTKLKTDDTSNEPGSGDDDEDLGKVDLFKKVNSSGTFEGSGEPDNEGSGSGDGTSGMVPTTILPLPEQTVKTEIRPTTDTVLDVSTEKATEKTTKPKENLVPSTIVTTLNTTPNYINQETTKKSDSTPDEVEDVNNVSPTTIGNHVVNVVKSSPNPNGNSVIDPGFGKTSQQKAGAKSQKKGLTFTVGIIIGVAIGAILAILIILFLVYRLRKKDEGSYSLDEPITGYQRHDAAPGSPLGEKEYYA